MISDLLHSWEETYKKGQLTLWIFLSLRDGEKYVDEIKEFIEKYSNKTLSCEEQSIYRSLRKYLHLGIVEFNLKEGNKGPDRKYYSLTKTGDSLLDEFSKRNISLFYEKKILSLLNQTQNDNND
ncbi:MAG: PadR family transcriptional regulator [Flavobacteriaceae bacterium]